MGYRDYEVGAARTTDRYGRPRGTRGFDEETGERTWKREHIQEMIERSRQQTYKSLANIGQIASLFFSGKKLLDTAHALKMANVTGMQTLTGEAGKEMVTDVIKKKAPETWAGAIKEAVIGDFKGKTKYFLNPELNIDNLGALVDKLGKQNVLELGRQFEGVEGWETIFGEGWEEFLTKTGDASKIYETSFK